MMKNRILNSKFMHLILSNKIIKNFMVVFSTQSIAGIFNVINSLLLIKCVGIQGNGVIALVLVYATLFNGLFNFQSYNALTKFGAEAIEKNNINKYKMYIKLALIQDIITALLAFIVAFLCLDYTTQLMNWDKSLIFYTKIYLITIPINITGSLNAVLRLNDEFHITGLISIYSNIIKFFLLIILYFLKLPIYYFIIVEIIYVFVNNTIRFYYAFRSLKKQGILDFYKEKVMYDKAFTKFNIYNNLVSTVDIPTGQAVSLIINMILGLQAVGIYNLLVKLGAIISQVTDALGQSIFLEFSILVARNEMQKALHITKKIFLYVNAFGIIIFFVSLLSYNLWLSIFMKPEIFYGLTFSLYFYYMIFSSSILPIHVLFTANNFVNYNLWIVIIGNTIYIFLLYILGNSFDLLGVVLSSFIQVVFVFLLKMWVLKKTKLLQLKHRRIL